MLSKMSFITLLMFILVSTAYAGKMHYYKDSQNNIYRICKDDDGYIVYKPGGSQDAYGRGYTWKEVKEKYGINKWFKQSAQNYTECPK